MNLPSYLLKNWASAELTRLGLSCHLAGEGKVRPMAWVARSLTTAGRFATAQILFNDAAASHIPQLLHLPEDLRSLPLQCFQRICHRDLLLEYSYSRILWLGQLFVNHLQSRRTPPRIRCATNSWVSGGPGRASLPEFLPATTHPTTAQRDDGVGAQDGPVHSGALESLSNDRFTACLDDARPNE